MHVKTNIENREAIWNSKKENLTLAKNMCVRPRDRCVNSTDNLTCKCAFHFDLTNSRKLGKQVHHENIPIYDELSTHIYILTFDPSFEPKA